MDLKLNNKVALITGASSGIGAATARLMAQEGADVIVAYNRNLEGARKTLQSIRNQNRKAWECQVNVADTDSVDRAIASLNLQGRRIDILVQCSGTAPVGQFQSLSAKQWEEVVDTNLNGPFRVLQALIPFLSEGASVVNVASVAAHTGVPHQAHYAAAKAGLVNLTKSAARALAPGMRVNCVAPGMTLTEMGKITATALPPDYAKNKILLQRFADPEEIAQCILFLASPVSAFITGETLNVNGGRDLR